MAAKQGMNPGSARTAAGSMQAQVNALSDIASALSATWNAGNNPSAYGIVPGEPTIAPWSLSNVNSARVNLVNAQNAANGLLQRIESEAAAQEAASGNDPLLDAWNAAHGAYTTFSDYRKPLSWSRGLLELPMAAMMAFSQGKGTMWKYGLNPKNWSILPAVADADALRAFSRSSSTPRFIRGMYTAASNLKYQNYLDPDFIHTTARHKASTVAAWADRFHIGNPTVLKNVKSAAAGLGKGLGVLGVASSGYTLATGISGAMDGDVTSEDKWAIADGAVGVITGIGSFAPPPVGLVFAGVGAAYSAGRWLFGEDENGKTGIQKTGEFFEGAAGFVGDSAKNINNFANDVQDNVNEAVADGVQNAANTVTNAAKTVANGAEAVGDFVEDIWPPW
jgi:hypothetical protein